mmetsp:Transcript_30777/g.80592  ORF Transcript_30777/g.80592 Transcript_30777/m.80592 type:complete len:228 (-) Transcript_30777:849-1532(-)
MHSSYAYARFHSIHNRAKSRGLRAHAEAIAAAVIPPHFSVLHHSTLEERRGCLSTAHLNTDTFAGGIGRNQAQAAVIVACRHVARHCAHLISQQRGVAASIAAVLECNGGYNGVTVFRVVSYLVLAECSAHHREGDDATVVVFTIGSEHGREVDIRVGKVRVRTRTALAHTYPVLCHRRSTSAGRHGVRHLYLCGCQKVLSIHLYRIDHVHGQGDGGVVKREAHAPH